MAKIKCKLSVEIEFDSELGFLEQEELISRKLNATGVEFTTRLSSLYDTNGEPLLVNGIKMTSKGRCPTHFQCAWGQVDLSRHVYQSNQGGTTFSPLDHQMQVIGNATPLFARMVASKYSNLNARAVARDLEENHMRPTHTEVIQRISAETSNFIEAKGDILKHAQLPEKKMVEALALSIDGTCLLMVEEDKRAWRQAMCGTISMYDKTGERLQTIYLATAPQEGKCDFLLRMDAQWKAMVKRYPQAEQIGITDGAKDYVPWITERTRIQILDFYHASEYLAAVARENKDLGSGWLEERLHDLKHKKRGASNIIGELRELGSRKKARRKGGMAIEKAMKYFENNKWRMDYAGYSEKNYPIGSGVMEAACKSLVKTRMCGNGMQWTREGAQKVLNLRAAILSGNAWINFWKKQNKRKQVFSYI